jgi:hypothetical protein
MRALVGRYLRHSPLQQFRKVEPIRGLISRPGHAHYSSETFERPTQGNVRLRNTGRTISTSCCTDRLRPPPKADTSKQRSFQESRMETKDGKTKWRQLALVCLNQTFKLAALLVLSATLCSCATGDDARKSPGDNNYPAPNPSAKRYFLLSGTRRLMWSLMRSPSTSCRHLTKRVSTSFAMNSSGRRTVTFLCMSTSEVDIGDTLTKTFTVGISSSVPAGYA